MSYIIAGGVSGKERLALLGSILNEGTLALLQRLRPGPVKHFLDLGCGGGSLSIAVARSGYARQVTGIDFDENIVALARADAGAQELKQVTFVAGDATTLVETNTRNVVYARFLLSHLTDPLAALQKMTRALRPGGLLLVEDVDFAGHFCEPGNNAFARYVELYERSARANGQDPDIGRRLPALLPKAGLQDVGFDLVQPVFQSGPGKMMAYHTLDKIGATLLHEGLTSATELQDLHTALLAFTEDPNSLISMPRIFRVWGTKGF
ncbi:MAG: methyltransferase domain-containing protein [Chitinophagaceae bacterium]|nr:MAG: methyltransferase domain-containing protein [Chitinophagaceae bacterium]